MANDNFDLPRPTDAVPSATSAVINDDSKVLDYVVNGIGTVTTRTGKELLTIDEAVARINWSYVGLFADGVTFEKSTDFASDTAGTQWVYAGAYPFSVPAGTVPSEPEYQPVRANSLQFLDGLTEQSDLDSVIARRFSSVSSAQSFVGHTIGNVYLVDDYYGPSTPNFSGMLFFRVVPAGTGIDDGGKYIDIPGGTFQLEQNLNLQPDVTAWGAKFNDVDDDSEFIQKAFDTCDALNLRYVTLPGRTAIITKEIKPYSNTVYRALGSKAPHFGGGVGDNGTLLKWSGAPNVLIDNVGTSDQSGSYTKVDCTLTFATDHYVVDYVANTQYVIRNTSGLIEGNQYRISFKLKNGTTDNLPITVYINNAPGAGTPQAIIETSYTSDEWTEYSYIFTADALGRNNVQFFSTMSAGQNYEIKDIYYTEVQRMVYVQNVQNSEFLGINLEGNFTINNRSAIVGYDIQSLDGFQNSLRDIYRGFTIRNCYHGIAISTLDKDSGNCDGWIFESINMAEVYEGMFCYSRFIAYAEIRSFSISYYKTGLNIDRATSFNISGAAGAPAEEEPTIGIKPSMFRFSDASGNNVITNSQSEENNPDKQGRRGAFATFASPSMEDNFNSTTFIGCYIQQDVDIYNRQANLQFLGGGLSHACTLKEGSNGSNVNITGLREYVDGDFILENSPDTNINRAEITKPKVSAVWLPPAIPAGESRSNTFTIDGVSTSDFVDISYGSNLAGLIHTAEASGINSVTITLFNPTASPITLVNQAWSIKIKKAQ